MLHKECGSISLLLYFYRSIFADDDDEDDNVADTLGISTKPVLNGEPDKISDEVRQFIPLLVIVVCVIVTWIWELQS